jgi:CRISPR-associated protein Cas5h
MPLVFDVYGSMAMFRKSYTTTSSVSFPFPPPRPLRGFSGAIPDLKAKFAWRHRSGLWEGWGNSCSLRILRQELFQPFDENSGIRRIQFKNPASR